MLTPFKNPGYAWLWWSNAFSSSGRWALILILSLQLLQTTHSSFWVGLGLFLTQGPVVLLAPLSGVLADRFDRRTLNVMSAALAGVTTGVLALTTWLGVLTLPLELALSLAYGVAFVFQLTLRSTLVPSLVPPAQLVSAVSLFQVGTQGAQFLGPALATPLLVRGGPALAWLFCTGLYAASALTSIPVGPSRAGTAIGNPTGVLQQSFRYLYARPLVWTAIWAVSLHCALTMAYQGMLPMFVSTDLRAPDSSYGALLTSIGLGAALGSLGLARLSDPRFRPALFGISLTGSGISLADHDGADGDLRLGDGGTSGRNRASSPDDRQRAWLPGGDGHIPVRLTLAPRAVRREGLGQRVAAGDGTSLDVSESHRHECAGATEPRRQQTY
ncbi:MAG: MFS transporter [Chloroflexi bacterium]|nr:MAG: MFS transporter [Chloroflexota bacterium]